MAETNKELPGSVPGQFPETPGVGSGDGDAQDYVQNTTPHTGGDGTVGGTETSAVATSATGDGSHDYVQNTTPHSSGGVTSTYEGASEVPTASSGTERAGELEGAGAAGGAAVSGAAVGGHGLYDRPTESASTPTTSTTTTSAVTNSAANTSEADTTAHDSSGAAVAGGMAATGAAAAAGGGLYMASQSDRDELTTSAPTTSAPTTSTPTTSSTAPLTGGGFSNPTSGPSDPGPVDDHGGYTRSGQGQLATEGELQNKFDTYLAFNDPDPKRTAEMKERIRATEAQKAEMLGQTAEPPKEKKGLLSKLGLGGSKDKDKSRSSSGDAAGPGAASESTEAEQAAQTDLQRTTSGTPIQPDQEHVLISQAGGNADGPVLVVKEDAGR